jgi:hypothetical protein
MTSLASVDLKKTEKRIRLAVIARLALLVILCSAVLAQNCQMNQEGSAAIDNQIQQGKYVIPCSFFGMHINKLTTPWPAPYFANLRLQDSYVNWLEIEMYGWKYLDGWIAEAQAHNVTLLYTFDGVPTAYSSVPGDTSCAYAPGACHPPKDLNEDGGGTDAVFQSFVTDLVKHNAEMGNPIQYWEIWNEPNQPIFWVPTCVYQKNCYNKTVECTGVSGTNLCYAQLLRMASDATAIIKAANPNAVILTPSPVGWIAENCCPSTTVSPAANWMSQYLQWLNKDYGKNGTCPTGTPPCPDVISFHGYLAPVLPLPGGKEGFVMGGFPVAENEPALIEQMKTVAKDNGEQGKPLWISEGSWGSPVADGFSDAVLQTAFLARYMLLQQSMGIAQGYWYQWDSNVGIGTLWQGTACPSNDQCPNDWRLPGYAYNSIVNWTMGATLTSACALQKGRPSVWVCKYSRSGPAGYKAEAVWNTQGNSNYKVTPEFGQYCDLKGNMTQITNNEVQIGILPILLENEKLGQTACQQ